MASNAPRKVRRRPLDHLRQKLWAVPAELRLRVTDRRAGTKPRLSRVTNDR